MGTESRLTWTSPMTATLLAVLVALERVLEPDQTPPAMERMRDKLPRSLIAVHLLMDARRIETALEATVMLSVTSTFPPMVLTKSMIGWGGYVYTCDDEGPGCNVNTP